MRLFKNIFMVTLPLFFLMASCSNSQKMNQEEKKIRNEEPAGSKRPGKTSELDKQNVVALHKLNLYVFMASEAAKVKALTAPVKNLADSLKINHAKMDGELQAMAPRKGIELPSELDNDQKRELERIGERQGILFCKEYVKQMKNIHEEALRECQKLADKADDAEIKLWAQEDVKHVKAHLEMTERAWNIIKDMKKDLKYNNNTYR